MSEQDLQDVAWSHGYAFGKYTQQTLINDDLIVLLDNSKRMLILYQESYNQGFKAGLADTQRQD